MVMLRRFGLPAAESGLPGLGPGQELEEFPIDWQTARDPKLGKSLFRRSDLLEVLRAIFRPARSALWLLGKASVCETRVRVRPCTPSAAPWKPCGPGGSGRKLSSDHVA